MDDSKEFKTFFYGLDSASHDFSKPESLGKNIFTNALPISLAQYIHNEKKIKIPTIKAGLVDGELKTYHEMVSWKDIVGVDSKDAHFEFECVYSGYGNYTHTGVNKSDVVVLDKKSKKHLRPLEIKLVVVPTSSTADKPKKDQSCEIVVRPPTVEQLSFAIAHSYGENNRIKLQKLIVDALEKPNDYKWSVEDAMINLMPKVLDAARNIVKGGIDVQTPLVMTAIWRTEGQKPVLAENAFDVFVWTDMAFVQLFIDQVAREYSCMDKKPKAISRPNRALIWLVKSLYDYSVQKSLNFRGIHSEITYGVQTDKAGSFSGAASLKHLNSEIFQNPRVSRNELNGFLSPLSAKYLMPERRLDAAIAIQHLASELSRK